MSRRRARHAVLGLCLSLAPLPASSAIGDVHLLVVSGLGGEPYYRELFHRWSVALVETAQRRYGMDDGSVRYLSAHPELGPERADGVARKRAVLDAVTGLAERTAPGDRVLIVLIGHGSAQGPGALFNLPGPDLAPDELDAALERLDGRRLALVNTTPASAPFIAAISGEGRVIITATANAAETQHTRFAGYFVEALANPAADTNKDGAVSLLEAFRYARRAVAELYRSEDRIPTEHAVLDDNGDGRGSTEPGESGSDGHLARGFTLTPSSAVGAGGDPRVAAARLELEVQAQRLVDLVERLKLEKRQLPAPRYEARLESLLVALALNRRAFREVAPE